MRPPGRAAAWMAQGAGRAGRRASRARQARPTRARAPDARSPARRRARRLLPATPPVAWRPWGRAWGGGRGGRRANVWAPAGDTSGRRPPPAVPPRARPSTPRCPYGRAPSRAIHGTRAAGPWPWRQTVGGEPSTASSPPAPRGPAENPSRRDHMERARPPPATHTGENVKETVGQDPEARGLFSADLLKECRGGWGGAHDRCRDRRLLRSDWGLSVYMCPSRRWKARPGGWAPPPPPTPTPPSRGAKATFPSTYGRPARPR
jgi:hypothetical protein